MNERTHETDGEKSGRLRRSARKRSAVAASDEGDKGAKGDKKVDVFTAFLDALHAES